MTYQRPSDAWTSTWPDGEEGYREARACLANLNCGHLEKIALATRKAQSQDPSGTVDLECTIDASRFDGTALHIMLEVAFSDALVPLPDPGELARQVARQADDARRAAARNRIDGVGKLTEEFNVRIQSIEDPEVRATFERNIDVAGKEAVRPSMECLIEGPAEPKHVIGAIEDGGLKVKGVDGTLQDYGGSSGGIEASVRDLLYTIDSKRKDGEDAEKGASLSKLNRHDQLRHDIGVSLSKLEKEWQRKHDIHGPPCVVTGAACEVLPTELSTLIFNRTWGKLAFLNNRKSPWTFIPGAKKMLELMHRCPTEDWEHYLKWRCSEAEPMILGLGNWPTLSQEPKTE